MIELQAAYSNANHLIHILGNLSSVSLEPNNISYPVTRKREVCPEVWMGMKYGYPFYYTGYIIDPNCTYGVPLETILTIALSAVNQPTDNVARTLSGIMQHYPSSNILIAVPNNNGTSEKFREMGLKYSSLTIAFIGTDKSLGLEYQDLLPLVKTKYVLIGRNITYFDDNARLERLVRMIDYLDVDVVGGAHRNWSGYWNLGCYQMKMRNYAYRIVHGYEMSYNSCIYCDYLSAPFAAKTSLVKELLSKTLTNEMLFLDFFAQLQRRGGIVMNCPDSLFYTTHHYPFELMPRADWLPFMNQWKLLSVQFMEHPKLEFTCAEVPLGCGCRKGVACSPCCLKELQDMMKYFFRQCEEHGIGCEIEAGSQVGAVKLGRAVYWEKDGDLNYRAQNESAMEAMVAEFSAAGYRLVQKEKCPKNLWNRTSGPVVNCGYFALRSKNWRIECWGSTYIASDILVPLNVPFLKIKWDGQWMLGYPNPGAYTRNLYGDDSFQHVEHWMDQGYATGWVPYKTGVWNKCSEPGFHACLDNYLPVGDIQFHDVWL